MNIFFLLQTVFQAIEYINMSLKDLSDIGFLL